MNTQLSKIAYRPAAASKLAFGLKLEPEPEIFQTENVLYDGNTFSAAKIFFEKGKIGVITKKYTAKQLMNSVEEAHYYPLMPKKNSIAGAIMTKVERVETNFVYIPTLSDYPNAQGPSILVQISPDRADALVEAANEARI